MNTQHSPLCWLVLLLLFSSELRANPELTTDSDKSISTQRETARASDSLEQAAQAAEGRRQATFELLQANKQRQTDPCKVREKCEQVSGSIVVKPGAVVIGPVINTNASNIRK